MDERTSSPGAGGGKPRPDRAEQAKRGAKEVARFAADVLTPGGGAAKQAGGTVAKGAAKQAAAGAAKHTAKQAATGAAKHTAEQAARGAAKHTLADRARTAAKQTARDRLDRATAPAAPDAPKKGVKENAKQAVKDVGRETLVGAAQGLIAGGGAGAAAGAAKGAVQGALTSKSTRKLAIVLLIPLLAILFGPSIASTLTVTVLAAALTGGGESASASAAHADGVDPGFASDLWGNDTAVPWQLTLWLQENEPELLDKTRELEQLIAAQFPDRRDADLRNGAYPSLSNSWYTLSDDPLEVEAQERTEQGYIAVLTHPDIGLDEETAKTAFQQARTWALGFSPACNADGTAVGGPGSTGTASEDGETITLDGWGTVSGEQIDNALQIIGATNTYLEKLPEEQRRHAGIIALSNAMRESTLRNVAHGDAAGPDSRGLFQQRDHYGPESDRLNPAWATTKFLYILVRKPEWFTRPQEEVSHDVQIFNRDHIGDQVRVWAPASALYELLAPRAPKLPPIDGIGVYDPAEAGMSGDDKPASAVNGPPDRVCEGSGVNHAVAGWPVEPGTGAHLTGLFGPRVPPVPGVRPFHHGLDFSAPGTGNLDLYAVIDGTVTRVEYWGSYGNVIDIASTDGTVLFRYAHLAPPGSPLKVGDKVVAGQVIGTMGTTGASTGVHLHFEHHVNGVEQDPVEALGGWGHVLAHFPPADLGSQWGLIPAEFQHSPRG